MSSRKQARRQDCTPVGDVPRPAHGGDGAGQDMLRALQRAGYRITAARRAVVEVLEGQGHKSAPEIVTEVRRRHPGVGRASVYRTLAILSRLCALQPSLLRTAQAHYAASERGHHHHFICNQCHRIIEFAECTAVDMVEEMERRWGVRIQGHLLEFYGLCPACAAGTG